jgi:hypothetical protein
MISFRCPCRQVSWQLTADPEKLAIKLHKFLLEQHQRTCMCQQAGCGHPRGQHDHDRGDIICLVPGCNCTSFKCKTRKRRRR